MLDHDRQPLRCLIDQLQQCRQPVRGLSSQPVLVNLGLRVQHGSNNRGLRAKHRAEPLVVLAVRVLIEDVFGLGERLVGYALKLSGGIE